LGGLIGEKEERRRGGQGEGTLAGKGRIPFWEKRGEDRKKTCEKWGRSPPWKGLS